MDNLALLSVKNAYFAHFSGHLSSARIVKREILKTMKKIFSSLLILFVLSASGQNVSQFKDVPASDVVNELSYINGNKYQKDALLFMDMLASTHPYYIKADKREVLLSRLDGLLAECAVCKTDSEFVKLLRAAMVEVRDKHTEVIDAESLPRFDKLLDAMFADIEKQGIATLIVDVQYNNGGSSKLCDELLDRLCPLSEIRMLDTYMRFSPLLALYNPKAGQAMKAWEEAGHSDELYPVPQKKKQMPEHKYYEGKVVFIQGPRTFSSAGILITTARDNNIGTIIGTESTFSPSHYGEVLPFRLPNTGVLGSVCTKYFERADKDHADDSSIVPDIVLDLDDKPATWETIIRMYASK